MTRVFDGEVHVSYHQGYVLTSGADPGDLGECFAGQANGLCGAARPGMLFLTTGLHSGPEPFVVDVLEHEPDLPPGWEDIVEVFLDVVGEPVLYLQGWGGASSATITLPAVGSYRVRYCAAGMDPAGDHDTRLEGQPALDRYLLQLWPAPPTPDVVLRATSATAAYWHRQARIRPAPPSAEQREAAAAAAREHQQQQYRAAREAWEIEHDWSGRAPSPRLREVDGPVRTLARIDRDLVDDLAGLSPDRQRALAHWLVHRAFEHAGLDDLSWGRAGLDALDAGSPPPPPFDDPLAASDLALRLDAEPPHHEDDTTREHPPMVIEARVDAADGRPPDPLAPRSVHRPVMAVNTLPSASADDPLAAVFATFDGAFATFGDQPAALLAELRARVTAIRTDDGP